MVLALGAGPLSAFAQSPSQAAPRSFEVTSVKPSNPNASTGITGSPLSVGPQGTGGFTVSNVPFRLLIYTLVPARSDGSLGADLKPSSADCSNAAADMQKRAEEIAKGGAPAINPSNLAAGFALRGNGQTMSGLTQFLTQIMGRTVYDKTGLNGLCDFELRFDPQILMAMLPQLGMNLPPAATANLPGSDNPALLTAFQEQLGLRLESGSGPVDVLVIDNAEMPLPD